MSPISLLFSALPFLRFSVVRQSNGSIETVLFPPSETDIVLAFKKTVAKLFSVDAEFGEREDAGGGRVFTQAWVESVRGGREKHVEKLVLFDASSVLIEVELDEIISSSEQSEKESEYCFVFT